jgi:hypothetical protein
LKCSAQFGANLASRAKDEYFFDGVLSHFSKVRREAFARIGWAAGHIAKKVQGTESGSVP